MYKTLVLNVAELWLKGKNRPLYFKALKNHVKSVVKSHQVGEYSLRNEQHRLVLRLENEATEELIKGISCIPGLTSFTPALTVEVDVQAIMPAVRRELDKLEGQKKTFKVVSKRVNKSFKMGSMDLSQHIGGEILKEYKNLSVDIRKPELIVDLKVLDEDIFVSTRTIQCPGGLPVGTSGHLVSLLSGGFDSPVASYMMAKRGCRQEFIFFYAYPFVGEEVKEKIISISKVLARYQNGCRLYVVPFGDVQNHISKHCKEDYRTLLFRKYMMEIASMLADKIGADALCTGDALGQVSSQTIFNMAALDKASKHLILRPLVGHNKLEILDLARQIETHDISIIPHDDACALFAPKHPVIRPHLKYWDHFIENNDVTEILEKALNEAEIYKFNPKGEILS